MGEWCTTQHGQVRVLGVPHRQLILIMSGPFGQSGLTRQAIESPHTPAEVASYVLEYVKRWVPEPRTGVLAGNSVHADAMFLRARGPDSGEGASKGVWNEIIEHLHYRSVVSIS